MKYKIFELVPIRIEQWDIDGLILKDTNEVFEDKQEAINKIERVKIYSFSDYIILETH